MTYCTVPDVRRALQETIDEFDSGSWGEANHQTVVDAIKAQEDWLDKEIDAHWYESGGIDEDSEDVIPSSPKTRDDELNIPTTSVVVAGRQPDPELWNGWYTRVKLPRKYVQSVDALHVRMPDGYEDWTSTMSGGTYPTDLGEDYMLRVNNYGVSYIYLNTYHFLTDRAKKILDNVSNYQTNRYDRRRLSGVEEQWTVDTWANAVYAEVTYGQDGIPATIRRATAFRAATELLMDDQANLGIPENSQLVSVESKKQAMEKKAKELLRPYRVEELDELEDTNGNAQR